LGFKIPEPPPNRQKEMYAKKWEKYGAYYDIDQIHLVSTFTMDQSVTIVKVLKQIVILTTEGSSYGTVPVKQFSHRISKFLPKLSGPNGEVIPLDIEKMRKSYVETGKVVFPKVTKGSIITIEIDFTHQRTYYSAFTDYFSCDIPVRYGRFCHQTSSTCLYDYKTCGNRYNFSHEHYDKRTQAWVLNDYEPLKKVDFLDYRCNTEPKVIARLLKVHSWNKSYNTKDLVVNEYEDETEGLSVSLRNDSFNKTVYECTKGITDPLQKAKILLKWVQDNMSATEDDHDFYSNLYQTGKGSHTQIAVMCDAMFRKAGINSRLVITSDKKYHSFDSSFVLKNDYLNIELPVAVINNKTYVAYPFSKGYELGEYPLSLNNVTCLELHDENFPPLPPPIYGAEWIRIRKIIDLSSSAGKFTLA